jgi:hypothetical protein
MGKKKRTKISFESSTSVGFVSLRYSSYVSMSNPHNASCDGQQCDLNDNSGHGAALLAVHTLATKR